MSLLVGITGGMGSGKTLAASFFHEFGAHILDADVICRKLVEPGQPALKENILHPRVFEFENLEYNNISQKHPKALVIIDAALLIESGNYRKMDKVIVVKANKKTQIERVLTQSGWSYNEVIARINNQMPITEKIKYADFVLDNSLDKASLRMKVKDLYEKLSFMASEKNT